ncbi:MAG TPA: transglycosylase SLT domain-containing protein [Gemmatimonadales bacterium]|nr:transglycosylase SLT domain-containing protein [Gemmatimonadales bacterium]
MPGSSDQRRRASGGSPGKGSAIQLTRLRREWNQLRTPSRPFLTFLAAASFAGALMLTPSAPLTTPTWDGVVVSRAPSPREPRARAPIDSTSWEREVVARYDHLPLAQILRRSADPEIANRVARAIIKEARQLQLSPSLLAGVLLIENSRLEPETVSHKGAIGLMQVMRFHAGVYDCDSDDLLQVEANICHGSRVFASYLKRTRDVRSALLRYNGCVRSRATSSCRRYPSKVLRQAEEIRQQLLLYLPRQKLSGA